MIISPTGSWQGEAAHTFDQGLSAAINEVLAGHMAYDFGCGNGAYVQAARAAGIDMYGFDGNRSLNAPYCSTLELHKPLTLSQRDAVLSLEVGEHIPRMYEWVFLNNVAAHARSLVILSWAVPGQRGRGHVNCRSNIFVMEEMRARGWCWDAATESLLRDASSEYYFKNTIMVFRR